MNRDFSKGKIYKITNDFNDDVYIGSTCDTLAKRFSCHKSMINNETKSNRPLYKLMNEIGTDRFRIELIENYSCDDKYQLRQREGFWIRQIGNLNKKIECRTTKEWYEENKEQKKQYREQNKEHIKEIKHINYENNKDKLLEKAKEYRDNNKDKIKEYRENNKDKILEKVICECGCEVSKKHLSVHKKSKKHLALISNN